MAWNFRRINEGRRPSLALQRLFLVAHTGTFYTIPVAKVVFDFYKDNARIKGDRGNYCYDTRLDQAVWTASSDAEAVRAPTIL